MSDVFLGGISVDCVFNTPEGHIPLDWLRSGDLVETRDHGFQPIKWISRMRKGSRVARWIDGVGCVLPAQRMLVDTWPVEVYFGYDAMLAHAADLVSGSNSSANLDFAHVVLEDTAILRVGTVWMESHGHLGPSFPILSEDEVRLVQRAMSADLPAQDVGPVERSTIGSQVSAA